MARERDLNWTGIVFLAACLACSTAQDDITDNEVEPHNDRKAVNEDAAIKEYCAEWGRNGRASTDYWFFKNCRHELKYSDYDVEIDDYQLPENFNLEEVLEALTTGPGYYIIRKAFSEQDVEMARERVIYYTRPDKKKGKLFEKPISQDEKHNNFGGMIWGLLYKGRIFEKMVMHPTVRKISQTLLGESCQLSSLSANTVLPGSKGQTPHLDYPYYRMLYPEDAKYREPMMNPLMVLQFVTLLTEFTNENGGTAMRPDSHKNPSYPDDVEDFHKHAIQVNGQPGDIAVFAGSLQHAAMPNKSKHVRSGLLLHMGAVYVTPFEDIRGYVDEKIKSRASDELKKVLALDHPYPTIKA